MLEVGGSSGSIWSNALLEKGHPEPRWLLKISIRENLADPWAGSTTPPQVSGAADEMLGKQGCNEWQFCGF